jgi:hypothetical protein
VSDEDKFVMVGGGGDPTCAFFERKPAWNRFAFGLISIEGSGAAGIGEEPRESFEVSSAKYGGRGGGTMVRSTDETSGVDCIF